MVREGSLLSPCPGPRKKKLWPNPAGINLLTSYATVDGWLVDNYMRTRTDVKFHDNQNKLVNVWFKAYQKNPPTEVIDVEASPPMLQQILTMLEAQTKKQAEVLNESKGIFQQVQTHVQSKFGELEEKMETLKTGTNTALLEQKDIGVLPGSTVPNSPSRVAS